MPATSRGLYLRVGVLILVGLALGVAFILFFTAGKLGRNTVTYETYIRESVQGLDIGAAVRFRGVQLGQITEINLVATEYPPPEGGLSGAYQRVIVRFALDLSRLRDAPNVERAVANGLRARLASTGITGVGYLELDFVDSARFPVEDAPWTPQYPVIPAVPSTVAQVTSVAEQLALRISNLPIEQIMTDMAGLLTDLRRQVSDGDVAQASRAATETLDTLRQAVQDLNLAGLSADLRATLGEAQSTIEEARGIIGGPEVRGTLRNANASMERLQAGLARLPSAIAQVEQAARSINNTVGNINGDLAPTLRDLRATSGNLRDTTEMLRRAPGAAILAPPPPAPDWARRR
ncbi:MCE family protein [Roseomonas sp. SSH11]|uniref:MCE family protein n=1 Tax=Pararoseomonas baculiformis TaxID=2820812 RepID=A0ABS4AGZ6_9PROT|nr:MlaD family protein [Pararoseomonas baculiformis]MBP0446134.1 MCE family protein [Pararoseomonas baculiformis]